jgi:hypothetical protein
VVPTLGSNHLADGSDDREYSEEVWECFAGM